MYLFNSILAVSARSASPPKILCLSSNRKADRLQMARMVTAAQRDGTEPPVEGIWWRPRVTSLKANLRRTEEV